MLRTKKEKKKETRKFILILCGMVFALAALIPVILYLTGVIGSRERTEAVTTSD